MSWCREACANDFSPDKEAAGGEEGSRRETLERSFRATLAALSPIERMGLAEALGQRWQTLRMMERGRRVVGHFATSMVSKF